MKYIVLLRKINVGTQNRIAKKALEMAFIGLHYENVSSYINSGNIIFSSTKSKNSLTREIGKMLDKLFGEPIQFLIKTKMELKKIADSIPKDWENDEEQKTDVAYLFDEVDNDNIIEKLPFKMAYVDVKYVKGALIWNLMRENQGKSQTTNLVGQKIYQYMTVRNVNTARYLGSINDKESSQTIASPATRQSRRVRRGVIASRTRLWRLQMHKDKTRSKEVDAYISAQPPETQRALEELRSYIWQAAPNVSELLNYNIPAFALVESGKRDQQVMIAGYPRHVGFYPHPDVIEAFSDQLAKYKYAKGSIQFPLNRPIPKELIIKMVKYRLSQLLK